MTGVPEMIGAYAIDREIGRGGMGVVYHGVDTRLGREVAIKALPPEVAGDPERLARFEREAKALAALNNPNVAGIYGVEEADGHRYLVLEYVAGETLEERLERGAMGVEDALRTAIEIARGLEAAHDAGVVHRDLKPANVKLDGGRVKILDFGLAVAPEGGSSLSGSLTASPTLTTPRAATIEGTLLGTAPYMSPEQARGRRVDRRTDVWSFGCVLYECLTGVRAFGGETVTDLLGAIVHKEVEWGLLPRETPMAVRHVLRRCLTKDRDKRLHDVADARVELEEALVNPEGMGEAGIGGGGIGWAKTLLLGAACLVVGGAGAWFGGRALVDGGGVEGPGAARKFDVVTGEPGQMTNTEPAISPDGTRLAYVLGTELHVRDFGSFEGRTIEGTENAICPTWSPDGRWIAFAQDRHLMKVAADGGKPMQVAPLAERITTAGGLAWLEDGRIVYTTGNSGLMAVSSQGGDPTELLPVDEEKEMDFHDAEALPGNHGVLFTAHRREGGWPVEVFDGERRRVVVEVPTGNANDPVYSPSGHVIYERTGANAGIWAVPFSLETLEATGEPFLVAAGCGNPSVAADGTLVFLRGTGGGMFQLVWVDRDANVEPIGNAESAVISPRISPDGTKIAVSGWEFENLDVWIHDLGRGTRTRLTFARGADIRPIWSQDGSRLAVCEREGEPPVLRFYATDGSGEIGEPIEGSFGSLSADWGVAAFERTGDQKRDIWVQDLPGGGEARAVVATPADERYPSVSPDGRLLAYRSDESGQDQIYLTRLPDGTGKWQVSVDGAEYPVWSRKGDRLYFMGRGGVVYEVEVGTEPSLVLGSPRQVVDAAALGVSWWFGWDVTPDDERLLMVRSAHGSGEDVSVSVVEGWYEEFRERE